MMYAINKMRVLAILALFIVNSNIARAEGSIIYSGPDRNIVYTQFDSHGVISLFDAPGTWDNLRLDLDVYEDMNFQVRYSFQTMLQIHGNYLAFALGGYHFDIKRFGPGQMIGAGETYVVDAYRHFSYYFDPIDPSGPVSQNGEFRNTSGYAGIKLTDGADTYYGWIRLSVENYNNANLSGTLIDWAYNSTPDQPILAGSTLSVEPANGPLAGGNSIVLNETILPLGNGSDITNVTVGGISNVWELITRYIKDCVK